MFNAIAAKKAGFSKGLMAALGAALLLGLVHTADAGDRSTRELHNAQIAGVVLGSDHQPVRGAMVKVTSTRASGFRFQTRTSVGDDGQFLISGLRSGQYTIEVFASERRYAKRVVALRPGETQRIVIIMD